MCEARRGYSVFSRGLGTSGASDLIPIRRGGGEADSESLTVPLSLYKNLLSHDTRAFI